MRLSERVGFSLAERKIERGLDGLSGFAQIFIINLRKSVASAKSAFYFPFAECYPNLFSSLIHKTLLLTLLRRSFIHVNVRETLFQVLDLGFVVDDDVRLVRVTDKVILMISLGYEKGFERRPFRDDRFWESL